LNFFSFNFTISFYIIISIAIINIINFVINIFINICNICNICNIIFISSFFNFIISFILFCFNNSNVYNNIETDSEIERKKIQDLEDIKRYNQFLNPNDSLIEKERRTILNFYFPRNPNRTNITIFYDLEFPFGNQIAAFNKLIFYCEIIKCQKILLSTDNKMYINHTLYDKDYNITIEIARNAIPMDDWLTSLNPNFFYDFYSLKVENRLDIIKNEIINNLPKIKVNKKDLIIHFRSSDVFQHINDPDHAPDYAQPPLCFYETILQKFNSENIYLISVDDIYNPVIKELPNFMHN
jgi:phosphate/sulfate permease